jgi:transcriptional activator of cad operon
VEFVRTRVGAWCVDSAAGQISRDGESARLDTRAMRLLLCLAEHPGEVVSIDELLTQVWSRVTVSPDSVYQAVASLRRVLGDDPKQPAYIATVPRLGYRMIAAVGPWLSSPTERAIPARSDAAGRGQRFGRFSLWAGGAALCLVLLGALLLHGRSGAGGS